MNIIDVTKTKRTWLNPKDDSDTGHLKTEFNRWVSSTDKCDPVKYDVEWNGSITIADCYRKVTLEFGWTAYSFELGSKKLDKVSEQYKERKKKFKKMRKHLEMLEKDMDEFYDEVMKQFKP